MSGPPIKGMRPRAAAEELEQMRDPFVEQTVRSLSTQSLQQTKHYTNDLATNRIIEEELNYRLSPPLDELDGNQCDSFGIDDGLDFDQGYDLGTGYDLDSGYDSGIHSPPPEEESYPEYFDDVVSNESKAENIDWESIAENIDSESINEQLQKNSGYDLESVVDDRDEGGPENSAGDAGGGGDSSSSNSSSSSGVAAVTGSVGAAIGFSVGGPPGAAAGAVLGAFLGR